VGNVRLVKFEDYSINKLFAVRVSVTWTKENIWHTEHSPTQGLTRFVRTRSTEARRFPSTKALATLVKKDPCGSYKK